MNINLKTEELEKGDRFSFDGKYVELVCAGTAEATVKMLNAPGQPVRPVKLPDGMWDVIR